MGLKLIKKIKIEAELLLLTGLHIGDSSENVEIGGIDNPVVRKGLDDVPYIPGSSLKGKLRSLLEQIAGSSEVGGNSEINDVFGFARDNKPSKLIVRDSYMSEDAFNMLEQSENTDMPFTEVKFENTIDRIKGIALHPRQMERVPAGTMFNVQFIVNVWDSDEDGQKSVDLLKKGINALENDYLGGSGTRGYGQVKFESWQEEEVTFEDYFKEA
ncbi:MAG: type III-A CRISPR-associated RAMP protein Csm3 [bacterium]